LNLNIMPVASVAMTAALQDFGAEPVEISQVPDSAAVAELMALARRSVAMRHWEREHLPIHASQLGFELFMTLSQLFTAGTRDRTGLLKQLYLMLPYSEKGVRLHLRRLEMTGWITVSKAGSDTRSTQVELSEAYWRLLGVYAAHCQLVDGSVEGVDGS
jgi:hypothetical protein